MQQPLFDPEYMDDLEKNTNKKKIFNKKTETVFEQQQEFWEEKKEFVEKRKIWRKNRR